MDYEVKKIDNNKAKQIIVNNHYSHTWTSCRHAIGLFKDKMVVGVATYGYPVGRRTADSISPLIKHGDILELTRLWVADSEGKNTESWFLGQTFRWMKQNDRAIKVLISYSDPNAGHVGTIYQATNWLYLGQSDDTKWYIINGQLVHPRTVFVRYGTRSIPYLKSLDEIKTFEIAEIEPKHRYLYILTGKRERKKIMDTLYKKPIPYVKDVGEAGLYNKKESDWFL